MVIDEKTGDENPPPLPRMYTDLAKCAVSVFIIMEWFQLQCLKSRFI